SKRTCVARGWASCSWRARARTLRTEPAAALPAVGRAASADRAASAAGARSADDRELRGEQRRDQLVAVKRVDVDDAERRGRAAQLVGRPRLEILTAEAARAGHLRRLQRLPFGQPAAQLRVLLARPDHVLHEF